MSPVLVVALLLAAPARTLEPIQWPGVAAAIKLVTPDGRTGVACVVAPRVAYTALHVVEGYQAVHWRPADAGPLSPAGDAVVTWMDDKRDLARLLLTSGNVGDQKVTLASRAVEGESVLLVNDDFVTQGRMFFVGRLSGLKDKRTLVMDITGFPGSSGGCVLNAAGELVAIYQGQLYQPKVPSAKSVGYGAPIWGKLEEVEK